MDIVIGLSLIIAFFWIVCWIACWIASQWSGKQSKPAMRRPSRDASHVGLDRTRSSSPKRSAFDVDDWSMLLPYGNIRLFDDLGEAVVVDVETTGLDPDQDRIVTLAMLKVDFSGIEIGDRRSLPSLYCTFNPGIPISKNASNAHGILDHHVKDWPPFKEDAQQVRDFMGDLPIVAHNATFDKKFLTRELQRAGIRPGRRKSYCTMRRFQGTQFQRGQRKGSTLDDVAELLGVGQRTGTNHNAVEDAILTAKIAAVFVRVDQGR